jgi:hypothetical protein
VTDGIATGIDLVFDRTAIRVADRPTLLRLAKRSSAHGWPASVSGATFTAEYRAPSACPLPRNLYVVRPSTAFGVSTADPQERPAGGSRARGRDRT